MLKHDLQALQQVIKEIGAKKYKVIRKSIHGYDSHGRVNDYDVEDSVEAIILPQNKNININSEGNGIWVTTNFSITVVEPYYILDDDVFITEEYGNLRVVSIDDNRFQGVMSADCVRDGSIGRYTKNKNY